MKHNTARTITDILMFFLICFLVSTGLLIHYRLLPGYRGGHGLSLLGLTRHEWGAYHLWAAYAFVPLLILHCVLNFAFIKNIIAAKKTWILLAFGASGLAIILFFLLMPIQRNSSDEGHHGKGRHAQHSEQELDEDLLELGY